MEEVVGLSHLTNHCSVVCAEDASIRSSRDVVSEGQGILSLVVDKLPGPENCTALTRGTQVMEWLDLHLIVKDFEGIVKVLPVVVEGLRNSSVHQ
jgi:hypothetical protein